MARAGYYKKGLVRRNDSQSLFQVFSLPKGGKACNLKLSFANIPGTDTAVLLSEDDRPLILARDQLRIGTQDDVHAAKASCRRQ